MSGYTKEPWHVHHDIDAGEWPMVMAGGVVAGVIVANVNPTSFNCVTGGYVEMPPAANAARIVACVNACAGMDDPAAEIDRLRARIADLIRQAAIGRLAVLALRALEWSRPVIDRNGFLGKGCIECGRDRARGHTDKCELAAILRDSADAGMGVES
jgi:hypothetical protein